MERWKLPQVRRDQVVIVCFCLSSFCALFTSSSVCWVCTDNKSITKNNINRVVHFSDPTSPFHPRSIDFSVPFFKCFPAKTKHTTNAHIERGVSPTEQGAIKLLTSIADTTRDSLEVQRLFKIFISHSIRSPSRVFYNSYLTILGIQLGDIFACEDTLKLLLAKANWSICTPDAPKPDANTFVILMYGIKTALEMRKLTRDEAMRRASWFLTRMSWLRIKMPKEVYLLLYDMLGVGYWDSLPWDLRLENRP